MADDPLDIAWELGTQLGHLVRLAQDPNDPQSLLLGEEIERLSHDQAASLLMVAVVALTRSPDFAPRDR